MGEEALEAAVFGFTLAGSVIQDVVKKASSS